MIGNSTIKQMVGKCLDCPPDSKEKPLTAKRCLHHYWIHREEVNSAKKPKEVKPRKAIPKVSAKQLENLKKYRKVRDEFMANKTCEAKLKGCTIKATDLHHRAGRSGNSLTDTEYFMALCRPCHNKIEDGGKWVYELGFKINRI